VLLASVFNEIDLLLLDQVSLIEQYLVLMPFKSFKFAELCFQRVNNHLLLVHLGFTLLVLYGLVMSGVSESSLSLDLLHELSLVCRRILFLFLAQRFKFFVCLHLNLAVLRCQNSILSQFGHISLKTFDVILKLANRFLKKFHFIGVKVFHKVKLGGLHLLTLVHNRLALLHSEHSQLHLGRHLLRFNVLLHQLMVLVANFSLYVQELLSESTRL